MSAKWTETKPKKQQRTSLLFQRGSLATLDGRTPEGRLARALERGILETLPTGEPTVTDRLLVQQLVSLRLQLDQMSRKMQAALNDEGKWGEADVRAFNSVGNQYRLLLRELRVQPAMPQRRGKVRVLRDTAQLVERRTANLVSLLAAEASGPMAGEPASSRAYRSPEVGDTPLDAAFTQSLTRPELSRGHGMGWPTRPRATPGNRPPGRPRKDGTPLKSLRGPYGVGDVDPYQTSE